MPLCFLPVHRKLAVWSEQRRIIIVRVAGVGDLVVFLDELLDGWVFDRLGEVGELEAHGSIGCRCFWIKISVPECLAETLCNKAVRYRCFVMAASSFKYYTGESASNLDHHDLPHRAFDDLAD